jgi:O-antigen biosynthesis protein
MRVSVIVPVHNDPRIEFCLSSLLAQNCPPESYEIIAVDNNSDDVIRDIICHFPVTYVREERQGSYFARNRGLEFAVGDVAAFIDADCVADPDWLSNLLRGFDDSKIGGVGGKILKLRPKTWVQAAAEDLAERQVAPQSFPFFPAPYIVTANAAYRMSILHRLGGFDTRFQSGGDVDLAWRVQLHGYRITTVPDAVVYHAARESLKGYFKQYFGYAAGHPLLFKKHHEVIGRTIFFNIYPFHGLVTTLAVAIPKHLVLWLTRRKCRLIPEAELLNIVKYVALVCGNVYGSIKHRVLFL